MKHLSSADDLEFCRAFEAFQIAPRDFDHEAHVRLAYVYLCTGTPERAAAAMKRSLLAFLEQLGIGDAKFHETLTQAWVGAVNHFMEATQSCSCFSEFIAENPRLLDSKIMLSHYSAEVLFSAEARAAFVEPDVTPIPRRAD